MVIINKTKTIWSKPHSFFYHYYKQYKCMSLHIDKTCYKTKNIECKVPCETKWNKTAPNLVMKGKAVQIEILPDKIIIS